MTEMYRNSTLAQNSDIHATPENTHHFEKFPIALNMWSQSVKTMKKN